MDNEIINLGEWNLPKGWDDISLKTFQEIERYYSNKDQKFDIRDVLHIVCNKTIDDVNALPLSITEKLLEHLAWFTEQPKYDEPTNELVINKERYIVNVKEKLKTGEFVAVDTVLKSDEHNYAAILAILCRKEGELYDSKFENEVLPERIKMFEGIPMLQAMRVITFFLQLWVALETNSKLYSKVEEALNLTAKNIESSQKLGVFKKQSLNWQIRKLRKLLKSTSNT